MQKLLKPPGLSAQISLNRRGEKRADAMFLAEALKSSSTKLLALVDLKVPIVSSPDRSKAGIRWLPVAGAEAFAQPPDYVFLGEDENGAFIFACNFSAAIADGLDEAAERWKPLVDLRSLALQGVLSEAELLIASQARAILGWHAVHRCCARCGARLASTDGGWRRRCFACLTDVYPRTDPAVIMLITRGDYCLLGHEHRFPGKLYSALAGYIEAGDDIEHAVRREIKEETAIEVGEVRYVASQPWPFPHSLMIGCWGEAVTEAISIDKQEIADARWFSREEAASMLAGNHPEQLVVPASISMAYTLIHAFVDGVLGGG